MGLSRLSKKCRECKHTDTCEHKRMEALAYLNESSTFAGVNAAASIMQPHDYRNINISTDATVTIDLEEVKKKIIKSMYPNFLYGD